jgi:hypothetical protein
MVMNIHTIPKFLPRTEAAEYVQRTWGFSCSPKWLAKLAVVGGGPKFRKAGRVPLYSPEDLDAWAEARIGPPVASTAELVAA